MAGSYRHVIDDEGRLLGPEDLAGMLENGGDVYEAVEEMYGMIWGLAERVVNEVASRSGTVYSEGDRTVMREHIVEEARVAYREGLRHSPGGAR